MGRLVRGTGGFGCKGREGESDRGDCRGDAGPLLFRGTRNRRPVRLIK